LPPFAALGSAVEPDVHSRSELCLWAENSLAAVTRCFDRSDTFGRRFQPLPVLESNPAPVVDPPVRFARERKSFRAGDPIKAEHPS
jgi:hypothetical protein